LKESKAHSLNNISGGNDPLPLYNFFSSLKQNNFLVTPKQITDSNSIIAEYAPRVTNESELCNYLSPIFANSPEEQVQFRQIFDEYFREEVIIPPVPLTFWQKVAKHIKKHQWKYILLALLLIAAVSYLMYVPKLDTKPVITLAVVKDSTGKKGLMQIVLSADNTSPDSIPGVNLTTTYNWGDGSTTATTTSHSYKNEGNFLVTAYSEVFYKGHFQYTDTAQTTAAVCFKNNAIKITPQLNGDTINTGQKIKLQAIEQGDKVNRVEWTNFEDDSTVSFSVENKTAVYSFKNEGKQTIYCTAVTDSLNSPCSVKDSVSFFVYDAKPKPSVTFNIPAGATILQPKYTVKAKWFYLGSALGLLSLFLTSFFAIRRSRLKREAKKEDAGIKEDYQNLLQSFSGKSGPVNLPFQNKNYLALPEEEINEIARRMRMRIEDDASFLHLPKTIEKAVINAGFFQPVHAKRTQQSEYLILIDEQYNNNQQVKLFEYLLELLAKHNVFIEKYYYKQQPRFCYSAAQPTGISLEKLSEKYPKHILLIMGNAYQLVYPLYPVIDSTYLPILNRWQYKAVLTPVSFLDWGNKEKKVLLEELPVLPVDIPGQLLLFQKLFGEEINILADLKQYSNNFYETELVDFENIDELSDYCSNAEWADIEGGDQYSNILLQWIAALAVYPKIQWELTLAIGKNILDKYGKGADLNFTSLLRIARIRWMVKGQFPDYTRLELLKKLSKENEVIARETILVLLNEISAAELGATHFAYEEKETQRLINEFNLYAYNPLKYEDYKRSKELVNHLWNNRQITDASAQTYIDNKELQWNTLINKPCKQGETAIDTGSVTADDYFGSSLNAEGWLAKFYLWSGAISAVVFVASLIGLAVLLFLNFTNKSFGAITGEQMGARPIKINYADSTLSGKINNLVLQVDTAQTILNATQPSVLMLPVDYNSKQVTVIADGVTVFDSLMPFNYDTYNISLGNNNVPASNKTIVTIQLADACASNIQNYSTIINEADTGFTVKPSIVNENVIAASKVCLTSIVAGSNVSSQKLDKLVAAFNKSGTYLKPGVNSKYFAAANEIVIYNQYDPVPVVIKPVVVIQVSDNSLAKTATAFKNDLTARGFTVKPVSVQKYNYNSEISYYDNSMQNDAAIVKQYYNKYYPKMKVQARLRKAPDAGDYKNIIAVWIKKLDTVSSSAVFDISNTKFPSAVTINQKFAVSFNVVNTNNGKIAPAKLTGSICILSEQTCSDFTFNTADISTAINQLVDISKKSVGRHEVVVTIPTLKINKSLGYFTITGRTVQKCDTIYGYAGNGTGNIVYNGRRYSKTLANSSAINFNLVEKSSQYAIVEITKTKCPVQKITAFFNKPQSLKLCDGSTLTFSLLNWENKIVAPSDLKASIDNKNIRQQNLSLSINSFQKKPRAVTKEIIFNVSICPPVYTPNPPVKTY
jgi:hypothetical protein